MPPDIMIKREHSLEPEILRSKIEPLIEETAKTYGLSYRWNGNTCKFEGQATGNIIIHANQVEISAKLSFAARFFKQTIEKKISEILDKALA